MNLYTEQKLRDIEKKLKVTKGEKEGRRNKLEVLD